MRSLLLLLFTTSLAFGQDSTIAYRHRYALKFDIGALIDPDRTVQVGLEFPISRRTSWQTTLGYGWSSLMSGELREFDDAGLWRLRNEVRFYTGRFRTNYLKNIAIKALPPLGNYWAVELLTKQINVMDKEYRMMESGPAGSAKPEMIGPLPKQRYVLGAHIKAGRQFAMPYTQDKLSPVLIDLYVGLGIRYAIVKQQSIQPNYDPMHHGMFRDRFQIGNRFAPSIVAGVKIGFAL